MFTTLQIAGKDYDMNANAATPIRYKAVFKKDFLTQMAAIEDVADPEVGTLCGEVAFIMNMSAQKANMATLTLDDYMEWLEGIDNPLAFIESAPDILDFYVGTMDTMSESKKKTEE